MSATPTTLNAVNNGKDEAFPASQKYAPSQNNDQTPVPAEGFKPDSLSQNVKRVKTIEETQEKQFERKEAKVVHEEARFVIKATDKAGQYFQFYASRLNTMRPWMFKRLKTLNAAKLPVVDRILHTKLDEVCYAIGTLYKDMPLKPNVLKEYAEERAILQIPEKKSFISDKDFLLLEDETGRIHLSGASLQAKSFLTGQIVAVKGSQSADGSFEAHEIVQLGFPPQKPVPLNTKKPRYVALVSGLRVGSPKGNPLFTDLLGDYLAGHLGTPTEQEYVSSIVRIVIAGNSFASDGELRSSLLLSDQTKRFTRDEQESLTRSVKDLDRLLLVMVEHANVDIMPGASDPSNYALPQQPLNRYLLPRSACMATCHRVTNPYIASIDGVSFAGHSGQATESMAKYMTVEGGVLGLMESTLNWRHMAPTAPDTLNSFPLSNVDPFILQDCPHVYFVGNQEKYETKLVKGTEGQLVRIVAIPTFDTTRTIVLVNLDTLNCHPITFSAWDDQGEQNGHKKSGDEMDVDN